MQWSPRHTLGALLTATLWQVFLGGCSNPQAPASTPVRVVGADVDPAKVYAGSSSCRECHEKFYKLWAPSHHGLAMQPCTSEFIEKELEHVPGDVISGAYRFTVSYKDGQGYVIEKGPNGEKSYKMVHAMGGKNVYFMLTPLEKGRLQVLPVSFKVHEKTWYDTTKSMLHGSQDQEVHWTDPLLTFNTSCFNCHVSQLSTNYDPATESYRTTWGEPGINCETCHNAAQEHVRVCRAAPKDRPPADLKIVRYKDLDVEQTNTTCALCHAKSQPLSQDFKAGDRFFDHADLVLLEHEHYYPDGRDSGENYTYTSWLMSPCVKNGKMTCIHCHTSSGRYRFKGENANQACAPCHQKRIDNAEAHHRHPPGKPGSNCIDCHMPMTAFAHMNRSDHSMRPPMPSATLHFKSPNACNLCHKDKDAKWADELVRKWHKEDYQAETLHWAGLVQAARKNDWSRLDEMLKFVEAPESDDVVVTSLLRMVASCPDRRVDDALIKAMKDPSPLVRASAANAYTGRAVTPQVLDALAGAAADRFRLVRMRAGSSLDGHQAQCPAERREQVDRAVRESLDALTARKDQWQSYYNLGNHFMRQNDLPKALDAFQHATRLRSDVVPPLVNAAIVFSQLGQRDEAEKALRQALAAEPNQPAVNFNLGLLLAEKGDMAGAEESLRKVLKFDPGNAGAAYNLGVMLADREPETCLKLCRQAWTLVPDEPKYAWTLAFYLRKAGQSDQSAEVLEDCIKREPANVDVYVMLAEIRMAAGDRASAAQVCERAAMNLKLPEKIRAQFAARAQQLK